MANKTLSILTSTNNQIRLGILLQRGKLCSICMKEIEKREYRKFVVDTLGDVFTEINPLEKTVG